MAVLISFFAGHFLGANGFKQQFVDDGNQVQHAFAGIYIGYEYGVIPGLYALYLEEEKQDDALYNATIPMGLNVNNYNYHLLHEAVRRVLHR